MTNDNPLLHLTDLPPFSAIKPEHVEPAIDQILTDNRAAIEALLNSDEPTSWNSIMQPLEDLEDRLARAWSPVVSRFPSRSSNTTSSNSTTKAFALVPSLVPA